MHATQSNVQNKNPIPSACSGIQADPRWPTLQVLCGGSRGKESGARLQQNAFQRFGVTSDFKIFNKVRILSFVRAWLLAARLQSTYKFSNNFTTLLCLSSNHMPCPSVCL